MRVRSAGKRRGFALVAGLATLSTAVTAATLVAPAEAAGPAWRVVKTYNHTKYNAVAGVVALSSKNAWALSGTNAAQSGASRPLAQHWNGKTWKPVALPGGLKGMLRAGDYSTSSDVWAIGSGEGVGSYVVRWNGRKWSVSRKWAQGQVTGITVINPKDVWVFGAPGADQGVGTWHFNGRSWAKVSAPFLPGRASELSGKNIWAIGRGLDGDSKTIGRWNGRKWTTVPTGSAVPSDINEPNHQRNTFLADLLVRSSKDVWVAGWVYESRSGSKYTETPLLVHYNGKSWKRVTAPAAGTISHITADGKGGLWFAGRLKGRGVLRHRSSAGKWTTASVVNLGTRYPSFSDLALIPRTTQVFAAGQLRPKDDGSSLGAIFRRS